MCRLCHQKRPSKVFWPGTAHPCPICGTWVENEKTTCTKRCLKLYMARLKKSN